MNKCALVLLVLTWVAVLLVAPVPTVVLAVAHPGLGDTEAGAALVLGSVANLLACNIGALATLVLGTVALLLPCNMGHLQPTSNRSARGIIKHYIGMERAHLVIKSSLARA